MRSVDPASIEQGVSAEAFGRMLKPRMPDGLLVTVTALERDIVAEAGGGL